MPRRTIATQAEISGIGLHTGACTRVSCQPGQSGQGVVFRRTDLESRPEIPARVSEVEATERRTAIGHGETTIHTVEHLLAAVVALELDDLVIELDGPEPPILDGSFAPYLSLLEGAGIGTLDGDPTSFRVTAPFTVAEGDATYVVSPAGSLRLTTTIEWSHP
jgi:UDP-3-O-acyl-N-acetylglucosamine deacetylase